MTYTMCTRTGCNNPIVQPATGRIRLFCSDKCRKYANRSNVTKLPNAHVTKLPDIEFYCGLNEKYWNYHQVEPGTHACIAPVTTITKEDKATGKETRVLRKSQVLIDPRKVTNILLDSGAFSDTIELDEKGNIIESKRLSYEHALDRQIGHAFEFHYASLVTEIVSYDLLIDEVWKNGERSKARWTIESAEYAVRETVEAARYLASQRKRIDHIFGHHVNLVLSAQGVEAEQYKRCAESIMPYMEDGDVFGLGGWCITGLRRHEMLPAAAMILPGVFDVLGISNVKRVHVFGVILPALLGFLLHLCDLHGIRLSTDSSGPCREPAEHGRWGYGSWTDPTYKKRAPQTLESCKVTDACGNKAPKCSPGTHCKGLERARHVAMTREYLADFRNREPDLVKLLPVAEYYQPSLLNLMEVAS